MKTNFDKVKELWTLENLDDSTVKESFATQICDTIRMLRNKNALDYCMSFGSCKRCYEWLRQEYKEPILDDTEKEYLSAVIKPFKNNVLSISKHEYFHGIENVGYIKIYVKDDFNDGCVNLPNFAVGTMYNGMKLGVDYTVYELGL